LRNVGGSTVGKGTTAAATNSAGVLLPATMPGSLKQGVASTVPALYRTEQSKLAMQLLLLLQDIADNMRIPTLGAKPLTNSTGATAVPGRDSVDRGVDCTDGTAAVVAAAAAAVAAVAAVAAAAAATAALVVLMALLPDAASQTAQQCNIRSFDD
jgi:hypothetical protein